MLTPIGSQGGLLFLDTKVAGRSHAIPPERLEGGAATASNYTIVNFKRLLTVLPQSPEESVAGSDDDLCSACVIPGGGGLIAVAISRASGSSAWYANVQIAADSWFRIGSIPKRSNAMSKRIFKLSLPVVLMAVSGLAFSATASAPIPVSATVSQACSISTSAALAFGAYDPIGTNASAPLNAIGQISVACSKGATGLTVGMGPGIQPAGAQRQMKGVLLGLLNYGVFQPASNAAGAACTFPGTIPWTDSGAGLLTLVAAPSKVVRLYNVCGTIPGGQDVLVDSYTDTVSATLNF